MEAQLLRFRNRILTEAGINLSLFAAVPESFFDQLAQDARNRRRLHAQNGHLVGVLGAMGSNRVDVLFREPQGDRFDFGAPG
jgi:hypothetical protein